MRRPSVVRGVLALAATSALAIAACGGSDESTGGGAAQTTSTEPIVIGVDMSLTGPFAAIGESEVRGIELAVKEINAAGGIEGRQLELSKLDDGSDPARAVTNVRNLIGDDVVAILGPTTGATAPQTATLTARQNVLQILGIGPEFVEPAQTTFNVPPPTKVWVDAATCYLKDVVGAKRVAGLFSPDPAGAATGKQFPDALKAAGMELVTSQQVALDATDTAVQWTRVRDAKPDAVLDFVTGANGGQTLKAAKTLGVDVPKVGYVAWALPPIVKLAGADADGVVVAGHIASADPTPEQQAFVDAFAAEYPDQGLDQYAAYGYDMVQLLAAALKANPNATQGDGEALAKTLEETTVKGVVAEYDYAPSDPDDLSAHAGVTLDDVVFLTAEDGEFTRNPEQPSCG